MAGKRCAARTFFRVGGGVIVGALELVAKNGRMAWQRASGYVGTTTSSLH